MTTPYYSDDSVALYLGDCLEVTEWLAADVLVTDPPYGIPSGRISSHKTKNPTHADAAWDDLTIRDTALALWGDRPRAVFGSPKMQHSAPDHRGTPLIWDKGESPGMGDYTWPFGANYELIWINGTGWHGKRRGSILRSTHSTSAATEIGHPTPKPVQLMSALLHHAPPGIIADPFAGSGSTLVAEIAARRLCQDVLDFNESMVKS